MSNSLPIGHEELGKRKQTGSHYTPKNLSDFVASQIIQKYASKSLEIKVVDPAVGDGELLLSMASLLSQKSEIKAQVKGFDIDINAIKFASSRFKSIPNVAIDFKHADFLEYVISNTENSLFNKETNDKYDIVIANPPYVRTQVLGANKAQYLAKHFGLKGRVDLYHAFILGIAKILKPGGLVGLIVSNRFMTTRSGSVS